ncbi:hypothetical protein [Dyadobacter sediminis]|uniref:Uncharacterized protein n=1 Tax=Dyadobacter sediminis TaxID=1493691 RepID=A0A5R9K2U0_9BACT|nr:hypothetical protein [Dyadobacter sediminis]TLU88692.1 hypothetical protein FEM55_24610 [Dyadobacter sediminis]GGC13944.1 hypothetical protein GCM10011325_46100 [Dyadobacter sediminis]
MFINGYQFLAEIPFFNLDDYAPYKAGASMIGKPFKVYSRQNTDMLYLHDLSLDLLFAFMRKTDAVIVSLGELIIAYYLSYPQNHRLLF